MGRRKRSGMLSEARRVNRERLARLGGELRASRRRRRLSQASVARDAGIHRSSVSRVESGHGGSFSADTLQSIALAVGRTLDLRLTADVEAEPADAGHLAVQELVLRLARGRGVSRRFELATRPTEPWRSMDVCLRDDPRRLLESIECWNTIGDVGAGARASERKRAEAEQLAVAVAPLDESGRALPYRVRLCWVVRATARNRALVARYPEVFATRFPGSSVGWVRTLAEGTEPPAEPGLVWCDLNATRIFAWRRRG